MKTGRVRSAAWIEHPPRWLDAPPPGASNLIPHPRPRGPLHAITRSGLTVVVHWNEGSKGLARRTMFSAIKLKAPVGAAAHRAEPSRGRETRYSQRRPAAFRTFWGQRSPVGGMPPRSGRMNIGKPVHPYPPASAAPVPCGNQEAGASFLAECARGRAIRSRSRRSGRVAEGGALLRRYGGECLHRGFESLLLRFRTRPGYQRTGFRVGPTTWPWWPAGSLTSCVKCPAYHTTTS